MAYRKPCQSFRQGASGGELLVPPRSSARMRLKRALSAKPMNQGAIATGNRFQKSKWSSIPRQCAHWHGMGWSWGCFRRKRRNPASLNEVRAGRILKEGGLVCGSKPFSASLSRILSPFLGGTRKGPPEGYPAESPDRASGRSSPPEAPSRKF